MYRNVCVTGRLCSLLRKYKPLSFLTTIVNGNYSTLTDSFGNLDPAFRDSKFKETTHDQKQKTTHNRRRKTTHDPGEDADTISLKPKIEKDWQTNYLDSYIKHEIQISPTARGQHSGLDRPSHLSPDVFGTLDPNIHRRIQTDNLDEEEDEVPRHVRLSKYDRRHKQCWYDRKLLKLCNQGQVIEALDLLEEVMIKTDRVMPTVFAFSVVIMGLGRCGHLKHVMQLFFKMKEHGLEPNAYTFSSIFNACGNTPVREDGIRRADYVRQYMSERNITPAFLTYKAMMKAYAIHGELQTTFMLMDEIIEAGYKADTDCYAALLMACISDQHAGYKHAIEVWRMMRSRGLKPGVKHYNLLVRAIRDCHIGTPQLTRQLLGRKRLEQLNSTESRSERCLHEDGATSDGFKEIATPLVSNELVTMDTPQSSSASSSLLDQDLSVFVYTDKIHKFPNILNPKPDFRNVQAISDVKTAGERLALIGGITGLLGHMKRDDAKPDVKTFTLLLDIIPDTMDAEQQLIEISRNHGIVKLDTDFYNLVMKRRVYRKDLTAAREMFKMICRLKLIPNFRTFGILSLTCVQKIDGIQFLTDMKNRNLTVTTEIYGHLLRASKLDFGYKLYVCRGMQIGGVKPGTQGLAHIERHIRYTKQLLLQKDRGEHVPDFVNNPHFTQQFEEFLIFYKSWLLSTEAELPEPVYPNLRSHRNQPALSS